MKPTLKEIEDNYERVLLQLDNGRLAGIKRLRSEDYYVVEQQDWNLHAVAIELSRGYNRESVYGYNIDRIKFLDTKNELTDFMDYGSETDITDWDWDINNPHNLKFKKGDVVKICKSESKKIYEKMIGKVGTIVDAEYKSYVDDELITYRVRIDGFSNEYQTDGLWVFHDENSLELYNPQCDDQMDAYEYAIQKLDLAKVPYNRDYIIKGENKTMNNILDIYEDRKKGKINKHYEQLMELTKLADERYAIFKDCSDKLDKLYKEDGVITNHLVEPRLAENTLKHLEKLAELREEDYCKLENLMREVHAQLSMCETYEQKQNVLNTYKILKSNGKINA